MPWCPGAPTPNSYAYVYSFYTDMYVVRSACALLHLATVERYVQIKLANDFQ